MDNKKSIFELAEKEEKSCFDKFKIKEKKKDTRKVKKQKRNEDIKNKHQNEENTSKKEVYSKKDNIKMYNKMDNTIMNNKKDNNKKNYKDSNYKMCNQTDSMKMSNRKDNVKISNKKDNIIDKTNIKNKDCNKKDNIINKKDIKKKNNKNDNNKKDMGVKLTNIETEILHKGTIKDKINLLTLIVQKNPSELNYKNLLFYIENQRNDVIYFTLKNIKDLLISKGVPDSIYIKQKITKALEINVKNTFIKTKVIRLVFDLLKNNILFNDLIYPFINKIGDKKDIEMYIRECLMSLFSNNEDIIFYNIEDFIFKNINFKCYNSVLKFLGSVTPVDKSKMIDLYKLILDNLDSFINEQRNILVENCLSQLCCILEDIENPKEYVDDKLENILCNNWSTDKTAYSSLKILYASQSKMLKPFIIKLLKNHSLNKSKYLKGLYIIITKIYDSQFITEIFSSIIFYRKDFLIAILSLMIKNRISHFNLLEIIKDHYSVIVRKMVQSLISKSYDKIEIEPFDKIQIEAYEEIYK